MQAALQQLDGEKSPDTVASLARLVEEALLALRRRSAGACAQALPAAVSRLAPLLAAESDATRHTAAATLVALLQACVTEEMAAADALDAAAAGGRPAGLQRCMAALTGMLGVSYRDAWPGAMRVLAAAFAALGTPGQHLVGPALSSLADMCRCDTGHVACMTGRMPPTPQHTLSMRGVRLVLLHMHGAVVQGIGGRGGVCVGGARGGGRVHRGTGPAGGARGRAGGPHGPLHLRHVDHPAAAQVHRRHGDGVLGRVRAATRAHGRLPRGPRPRTRCAPGCDGTLCH